VAGLYGPSGTSTSTSLYAVPKKSGGGGGVLGLFRNLGSDVKGAVTGFIPGVVHMAEHPIGGAEAMGKGIWSTWSPLIHGHFTQFGQGIYEHPLAPLLDLASVASLGLGTAARIGSLAEAGSIAADRTALAAGQDLGASNGLLHSAARLTLPKTRTLVDKGISEGGKGRGMLSYQLSTRPLRRLMQEHALPRVTNTLPQGMQDFLSRTTFSRKLYGEMARRATMASAVRSSMLNAGAKAEAIGAARAGHMTMLDSAMLVGKSLVDPTSAPRVRQELAWSAHSGLAMGAPIKMRPDEAIAFLKEHPHWLPVKAPWAVHGAYQSLLAGARRTEGKLQRIALKNAGLASALPRIEEQLAYHNAQLKEMYDNGYLHTMTPAKTKLKEPTVKQSMEQHAQPILEVQRNIKMLDRLHTKAIAAKTAHDDAVAKLADAKAARMALEHRSHAEYYQHVGSSEEAFNNFASNLGRYATLKPGRTEESISRALSKAWVGSDGKIPLVPRHDAVMMGRELHGSTNFLTKMVRDTTGFWKGVQVKFTPKTVLNNTVGNHIIYSMRMMNPVTATTSMAHALRMIHSPADTGSILMRATPWKNKQWFFQHFSPELHDTFAKGVLGEEPTGNAMRSTSRVARVMKGPGMYTLVQKTADEPVRAASIISYVHSDPQVIARAEDLMVKAKARGVTLSKNEALDKAAGRVLRHNNELKQRASEFGRTIAGDYLSKTPTEQKIKDWVPFYLWDRHIVKSGSNLLKDTPGRAVMLQQLSQMGEGQVKKYLGNVPDYLLGALPLKELGLSGDAGQGRTAAMVAPSLNPWGTLGDLAGLGQALTVGGNNEMGSDVFGQINPLVSSAIEYGTGKSLLTGAPVARHGGLFSSIAANLGQGFPETKVVSALTSPPSANVTKAGKPKLYAANQESAITNFLGVPIKAINPSAAAAQFNTEHKIKKSKTLYG
jgi:hypothetical protein